MASHRCVIHCCLLWVLLAPGTQAAELSQSQVDEELLMFLGEVSAQDESETDWYEFMNIVLDGLPLPPMTTLEEPEVANND